MVATPIFDGPPIFITFGFLLVLAGYLRQVSVAAQELRDRIQGQHPSTLFPWDRASEPLQKEKIRFQERMRRRLARLTHGLFILAIFLSLRIILFAVSNFIIPWQHIVYAIKIWFDLAIAVALAVLTIAMWLMHWWNRRKDQQLRERALAEISPPPMRSTGT